MPSRLIRRQPLADRIKAYLNPLDLLLWLSEEVDSNDLDQWQKDWGIAVGVVLNIIFLIARANSGGNGRTRRDDVFGDDGGGVGWLGWLATFIVHLLSLLSFLNAAYTFYRKRHYRLFEASVEAPPSTPSAHLVHVDSSPLSSSPLRFLQNMIAGSTTGSRSDQDARRDVWELAVWDPTPLCLRLFCLLSPGHVLVYWLFLPTAPQDTRPSTTVVTTIILACLLSIQLMVMRSSFTQQLKDTAVIQKEVMHEYDTKYVYPRTQPQVRDIGTQYSSQRNATEEMHSEDDRNFVETYTPTVIINRGFHTKPSANYVKHVDPEGISQQRAYPRANPGNASSSVQTPAHLRDASSPIRPRTAIRQPQFRASTSGDGGSLGVYSHANSPLNKAASTNFFVNQHQKERSLSPAKREGSPLKRSVLAGNAYGAARHSKWQDLPTRQENKRF